MAEIVIRGMDDLEARFKRLGDQTQNYMLKTTDKAVKYVHSQVPPYPAPSRQPYPFVSLRQRLFVLIGIRTGQLEVPYKRRGSGGIGGSITTEVRELGADVIGVIGTNKEYAPWVISSEVTPAGLGPQARYHQDVWWTLQEVVRKAWDAVVRIYETELDAFLK